MDLTTLRFIELPPTSSLLDHSHLATCDHFYDPPKSIILVSLGHMVIANGFDQTLDHIEIMGHEDLSDDSGHVKPSRMSVHDNCDILGRRPTRP